MEVTRARIKWISALAIAMAAQAGNPSAVASEVQNPLFGYTHLQPSPFTLPAGRMVVGSDIALGVTGFLQVGTNAVRDIYKFYNANAKISLIDYPSFAFALTGGYERYNLQDIDPRNPNGTVQTWQPGAVAAYELLPRVALFVGGNANLSQTTLVESGIETAGYLRGAEVGADLSWAYNPPSRRRTIGNVLSAGVSYDVTYKLFGFGVSHHWPGFHLGIHYYPGASKYPVQPIIAGGTAFDF